jgi:DNA-binding HxlR family transcriptional regulator/putative sterol carrier protein
MARRRYEQYCPAARALDVIGERWTPLVVRELLLGPKRYTDLLNGLPGIAPNLLAARLRQLQESGVIRRRTLRPPAASTVYELTPLGEGLRPVLLELGQWGLQLLGAREQGQDFQPGWLMQMLETGADREAARGIRETYEFHIEGAVFHVVVDDGRVEAREGPAEDPAVVSTTDLDTFLALGSPGFTPAEAISSGKLEFEGDPEAGRRAQAILGSRLAQLGRVGDGRQPVAAVA